MALYTACVIVLCATAFRRGLEGTAQTPDIHYVPTSDRVVAAMLDMAQVTPADVVYDLGSGDGRIVIQAAKKYGAHGVGIEIDPALVQRANRNARDAGVADKVTFVQGNIFTTDLSKASVVTLYLSTTINMRLQPKLQRELSPGTRIVSHRFGMPDWKPERTQNLDGAQVFLWKIP